MNAPLDAEQLLKLFRTHPEQLRARDASDLAVLGGAARWLLCEEALARLAEEDPHYDGLPHPRLPETAGSCLIVYEVDPGYPLLRPAFVLPLQWREGSGHDPGLPAKLRGLADRVLQHLRFEGTTWSLHRLDPFRSLDLNLFDSVLHHESGWAPLAGGLLIATRGGKPRPDVWATGRWDGDGGVAEVEGLPAKLDLARRWGAKEVFVPEGQACGGGEGLAIGKLYTGLRAPEDALRDYLAALDAPPALDAPREQRSSYYLRQPTRHPVALAYYESHLLPQIIKILRQQSAKDWRGWAPTHLVTVVSESPELIPLAARSLGVSRCLLLHTDDGKMQSQVKGPRTG